MKIKRIPDIVRPFDILGEKEDCGCNGHFWFEAPLTADNGEKAVRLGIRTDKGIIHYIDMPITDAISLADRIIEFNKDKNNVS